MRSVTHRSPTCSSHCRSPWSSKDPPARRTDGASKLRSPCARQTVRREAHPTPSPAGREGKGGEIKGGGCRLGARSRTEQGKSKAGGGEREIKTSPQREGGCKSKELPNAQSAQSKARDARSCCKAAAAAAAACPKVSLPRRPAKRASERARSQGRRTTGADKPDDRREALGGRASERGFYSGGGIDPECHCSVSNLRRRHPAVDRRRGWGAGGRAVGGGGSSGRSRRESTELELKESTEQNTTNSLGQKKARQERTEAISSFSFSFQKRTPPPPSKTTTTFFPFGGGRRGTFDSSPPNPTQQRSIKVFFKNG